MFRVYTSFSSVQCMRTSFDCWNAVYAFNWKQCSCNDMYHKHSQAFSPISRFVLPKCPYHRLIYIFRTAFHRFTTIFYRPLLTPFSPMADPQGPEGGGGATGPHTHLQVNGQWMDAPPPKFLLTFFSIFYESHFVSECLKTRLRIASFQLEPGRQGLCAHRSWCVCGYIIVCAPPPPPQSKSWALPWFHSKVYSNQMWLYFYEECSCAIGNFRNVFPLYAYSVNTRLSEVCPT